MSPPVTPAEVITIVPSTTPGKAVEEESTEPRDKTASATQSEATIPPTTAAAHVPVEKTPEPPASTAGGGADSPSRGLEFLTSPLFKIFMTKISGGVVVEKDKPETASGSALVVPPTCITPIVYG